MRTACTFAAIFLFAANPSAAEETFDCVMDPAVLVKVGSPVAGILESVAVARGEAVQKGDILARIDPRVEEAVAALLQARAESTAAIDAQAAQVEMLDKQRSRQQQLFDRGVVSTDQLEKVGAELELARGQLRKAELDRELAGLELARAKAALDQRVIVSPIDGIVVDRNLSAGEYAYQEAHIATLVQLDPLHVEAFLPVEIYPKLSAGFTGRVRPDAPVGGDYEAELTVVDRVFDAASGTFGVRFELPNPEGQIPAGHRCTLVLDVDPTG